MEGCSCLRICYPLLYWCFVSDLLNLLKRIVQCKAGQHVTHTILVVSLCFLKPLAGSTPLAIRVFVRFYIRTSSGTTKGLRACDVRSYQEAQADCMFEVLFASTVRDYPGQFILQELLSFLVIIYTLVGCRYTHNPARRLRCHNGEIFGGPASTAAMRPLEHVAIVYGFQSQREAMRVGRLINNLCFLL